jgi:ribosomal protein S12 methylthiotransferase accessory factor
MVNLSALSPDKKKYLFQKSKMDTLIQDSVGILNKIEEVPRFAGDPHFFHFLGKACNALPMTGRKNFFNSGGASIDRERAMYKAIGEAIERYSSSFYEFDDLPLTSFNDADFDCIHPGDFALYTDEQYDEDDFLFHPFVASTPVRWTQVHNLTDNKISFAPAAAVYMPYTYLLGDDEPPFLQPISTGLACHATIEAALIGAICEVVERDGVMIMWQSMLQYPHIRIETLDDISYDIVKRLEINTARVVMLNITTDNGIPTVLSILDDRNNQNAPAFIFAGASDPNREIAARKSLEELPHSRRYCARLMEFSPDFIPEFPKHANVKDQEQHLHFYCDHNNAQYAEFVLGSPDRISFDEIKSLEGATPKDTIDNLVKAIGQTGEKVYFKDLTTSDVYEMGYKVVRALVPGYQRLCMGYKNRVLKNKRLKSVPEVLKIKSALPPGYADNPAPHPYP